MDKPQLPQSDVRDDAQWAVVRRRVLTLAGNQIAVPVTAAATTKAITFPRQEPDTKYGVLVTPNWLTTFSVTGKTTSGCTVNFGTAAPANATIDFFSFRSE